MSERTKTRSLRAPRRVRAYLAANAERPALLLAASEEAAERYAREAEVFTDGPVVHLPSRGAPYGDVFDPAVSRVGRRQRALRSLRSARVVVAGPLAFMERTPLYEPMELAAGTEIELDATLERLVVLGYERVDRVSSPGEFAVRGGIVDVFPSTRRSPVRVEWWGDEIESVRAVSLATQRVVRELEAVTVYAAREGDLAGLAATDEELPEEARRGVRVPGLDRLLLGLNPVSPRTLLPEDVEVWREEPREDVPEDVEGLSTTSTTGGCLIPTSSSPSVKKERRSGSAGRGVRRHVEGGGPQARLAGRGWARGLRRVLLPRGGEADGVRVRGDPPHQCARPRGSTQRCRRVSTRCRARSRRGSPTRTAGSRSSGGTRCSAAGARRVAVGWPGARLLR